MEQLETRTLLTGAEPPAMWYPDGQFIQTRNGYLTQPAAGTPLNIALNYLSTHANQLGVLPADLVNPIVTDLYKDADTGVTHIYFRQRFNNLPVVNANLNVNITRDGRVLSVGGGFIAGTANAAKLAPKAPTITAVQAINAVRAYANAADKPIDIQAIQGNMGFAAPSVSLDPIVPTLHYVATAGGINLAWNLAIRTPDLAHWYDLSVDATTGVVIAGDDWMDHATYNVYPSPTEAPNDGPGGVGSRSTVTDPYDPIASPFGWHDTNGVAGPEFTDTRGNNASAQEDTNADNTGGFRPDGGSSLNFDFPVDLTQSPSAYQSAAIVNLFYWVNLAHDIHYNYGFNEVAGNFQVKNYTGLGLANDAVFADAQDGSGTNNANFSTPPDGQAPRMQMYLFNRTTPGRDGDFDAEIILHEFGHGVSNRLTGGPANSSALNAIQSGGMGEGWSDWWGLMLTQKASDLKTDRYPVGTYVLGQSSTTGAGIRRYPYSFDMTIDPLTIAYYNSDASHEVHNTGEIWSTVLWDMNWLLIDKYGFSADVAHGYDPAVPGKNGGNNLALQLVTDALKLQPANPSFKDARDAILQADQVRTGGANKLQIWTAFARRGMGYGFVDTSSSATSVTAAFDLPPELLKPRVASHSPNGVVTTTPTSVDFNFSKAMNPGSFSIGADVVSFTGPGGTNLLGTITGAAWLNSNTTLRLTFAAPTANGAYSLVLGPQVVSADDGTAVDQNGDGTAGQSPQDQYTATFSYDAVQLAVSSTNPANGSAVTTPFTTLELQFNEPVLASTVGTSDLTVSQGTVTGATLVNPTTVRYTLSGVTAEGPLNFTLAAGALTDVSGFANAAYFGSVGIDIGTRAMPGVTAVAPAGSQVYQTSASGSIGSAGDSDDFTILLDAGQTLTALLLPTTSGLRPVVVVKGPNGVTLGTATAAAANQQTVVQGVAATTAGVYTVTVSGFGSTTGSYTLSLLLNAVVEAEEHNGPTNDTAATAQGVTPGVPLAGSASMTSVLGTLPTGTGAPVYTEGFESGTLGPAWSTYSSDSLGRIQVTNAYTAAAGSYALLMDRTASGTGTLNEAIWTVNLAGMSSPSLTFYANTYSDEMIALPTSFTGHYNGDGVAISADGTTWYTVWTNASPTVWTPVTVDLAAAAATAGISLGANFKIKFQQYDDFPLTTDGRGWDAISITTPTAPADYYSVPLSAGQHLAASLARVAGSGSATVTIYDALNNVLASSASGASNVMASVADFVAPANGVYYLRVAGTSVDYNLVLTVDAAFDLEPNGTSSPQPLGDRTVVVGSVLAGTGGGAPTNPGTVYTGARDVTGTPLSLGFAADGSFVGPTIGAVYNGVEYVRYGTYLAGFTVSYNNLNYTNSTAAGNSAFPVTLESFGSGTLHGIRVMGTINSVLGFRRTIWWNDGDAYALVYTTLTNNSASAISSVAIVDNQDPDPGNTTSTINDVVTDGSGKLVVGGNSFGTMALGSLDPRAVGSVEDFYIYNPFDVINSPIDPNGASADDSINLAFNIGTLAPGQSTSTGFAMVFGASQAAVQAAYAAIASKTIPDVSDDDRYTVNLAAGQAFTIRTRTPGDGAGEFPNTLDPALELYDPAGNLVASDDNGAGDGRNALLNYVVGASGTYTVRVRAVGNTTGEYVLDGQPPVSPDGTPGQPDLLAGDDSGLSFTDNVTNRNNATPATALHFLIPATVPGATVTLYADGVAVASAVAAGYSTILATDGHTVLADGPHVFTVRQTPAGGVESPESVALTVTVMASGPAVPTSAPNLQAGSDSGLSSSDGLTNVKTPTFNLPTIGASYFRLYRNGVLLSASYTPAALTYVTPLQSDGTYTYTITAVDAAGNESALSPVSGTVIIDTVTPTAPSLAPDLQTASDSGLSSTDNITNVATPTFDLSAAPAGTYYRVFRGGTVVGASYVTGTPFTAPAQADGTASWTYVFVDAAGNVSASSPSVSVTIDSVAPATPAAPDLQAASDGGGSSTDNITNVSTPTFTVSGAPYYRLYRDGVLVSADFASATTYTSPALADGTYVFTLVALDAAGNASAVSAPLSVTIDSTILQAPSLYAGSDTGVSASDRITAFNNASPATALTFLVPGAAAGATLNLYADGVLVGTAVSIEGGMAIVITDGVTVIPDGSRNFTIRQVLPGQSEGLDSNAVTVTIDSVAPVAPALPDLLAASDSGVSSTDNITNVASPTLTVTGTTYYRLLVNGGQVSADYQTGNFVLPARSDGTYTVTAVAVDVAGNVSVASAPLSLTIDTIAPLPPVTAPDLQAGSDSGASSTDNVTNVTSPTFTVSGSPYFRFYRNGTVVSGSYQTGSVYTATGQTSGTWSYAVANVDAAGNVSILSPALSVAIDTSAPTLAAPDLRATSDSGVSNTDNITNSRAPVFDVTTTEPGTLRLMVGSTTYATLTVTAAGTYAMTASGTGWGAANTVAAGTHPSSVATADFDGDGKHDMVVADLDSGDLKIYRGNGDGTFGAPLTFSFGPQVASVVTGDFNRDGKVDIATARGSLIVLLGNGNGTFQAPVTLAGTNGLDMVTGDFNGDGKLDLASSTFLGSSGGVMITLGNGDGTFQTPHSFPTNDAYSPYGLVAADFNGDGRTDVATIDYGANSISVLIANADGSLRAPGVYATAASPASIVAADFNKDGKVDLAVTSSGIPHAYVRLGNGDGTFQAAIDNNINFYGNAMAAADMNGDGVPDLVANVNGALAMYPGLGNGTFGTQVFTTTGGSGQGRNIGIADLNGDGRPDAIALNYFSNSVTAVLNGAIPDGVYAFSVTFTDLAGNQSVSPSLSVTIDTVAPTVPTTAPDLNAASDSGVSTSDNITNLSSQTFTVSTPVSTYFRMFRDGTQVSGDYTSGTTYTATGQTDGTAGWTHVFVDAAGNASTIGPSLSVTTDTIAPAVPTAPPDLVASSDSGTSATDNVTNDNTPTLSFTASPYAVLYRAGTSVVAYVTTGTFTMTALSDGTHTFTIAAVDAAGNVSAQTSALAVVIDTIAPVPTVNALTTTNPSPSLSGTTDDPAATVRVSVNGNTYTATTPGDGTWTLPAGVISPALPAGVYTVIATATDLAGNAGSEVTANELIISPLPPVMTPEPAFTAGTSNTVSWAASPGADEYFVEYDTSPAFDSPDGNSGWIAASSHTFTGLTDGVTYYYRVKSRKAIAGTGAWTQTSQTDFAADTLTNTSSSTTPGAVTLAGGGTTVLFSDDFEDGDFNGWTAGTGAFTRQVTNTTAALGTYSLTLIGSNSPHYGGLDRTLGGIRPNKISFSVRNSVTTGWGGYVVLGSAAAFGSQAIFFTMNGTAGMGLYTDGGNVAHVTPYVANRWYNIELNLDWTNKRVDYFVDGTLIESGISFRDTAVNSLSTISLYNWSSNQAWWDQFSIQDGSGFVASGTVLSTPIAPGSQWTTLTYNKSTPTGTSLTVDVLNAATGTVLAANVPSGTNLQALGVPLVPIRLRANLATTNTAVTPSLLDWTVNYSTLAYLTSDFSGPVSSTQDATPPAAPAAPDLHPSSDSGVSNSDNVTNVTSPLIQLTAPEAGALHLVVDGVVGPTVTATGPGVYTVTATGAGPIAYPRNTYPAGTGSAELASADFNGDGRRDFVVTSAGGIVASVFLGNGNGTFTDSLSISVNDSRGVVAGDFNADGKADFAMNVGGTTLRVYLGNGNGTFQTPVSYAFDPGDLPYGVKDARYLRAADVNGDGRLDIVSTGGLLFVFLGQANGSFLALPAAMVSSEMSDFAVGDINGDGTVDLVIDTAVDPVVVALIGNGDGTFQTGTSINVVVEQDVNSVVIADLNNDGKRDLLLSSNGSSSIFAYLGNGDATFQPVKIWNNAGSQFTKIVAADLDGDGILDLAASDNTGPAVRVARGNGDGTFQPASAVVFTGASPSRLIADQFNGDGRMDLAVASQGGTVSVLVSSIAATYLADGTHTLTAWFEDRAGNRSSDSVPLSIVIDTVAPGVPGTPDLQPASDAGTSSSDNLTNDDTPTFDLPVPPAGLYARIFRNGLAQSPLYNSAATFTAPPQPDGAANWTVSFVDAAGNVSARGPALSVTIETTPPAVAADALTTIDETPAVSGTVDDPTASVVVTFNGQSYPATNNGNGTWALADNVLPPLPAGASNLGVTATDPAGNVSNTTAAVTVIPPPSLVNWVVNDGNVQRSMVKMLTLVFDQPVSLAAGAVEVHNLGDLAVVPVVLTNPTGDGRMFVVSFSGTQVTAGSLVDGVYELTLHNNRVHDLFGRTPVAAVDPTFNFHRLFGDSNGDKTVDSVDIAAFAAAQATKSTSANYRWYFDYDQDSDIDALDAFRFRQHQGQSLFY